MTRRFTLITTERFESQAVVLPAEVYRQLAIRFKFLETNPRHPSLNTHEVKHARGDFGGKIFESYVTIKYRLTWEYGLTPGEIVLRNVDNHDACLKRP